jgi:hypothetical protein
MEDWRTWRLQQSSEAACYTGRAGSLSTAVRLNVWTIHWTIYRIPLWAQQMINPVPLQMVTTKSQLLRPGLKEVYAASIPVTSSSFSRYLPTSTLTGYKSYPYSPHSLVSVLVLDIVSCPSLSKNRKLGMSHEKWLPSETPLIFLLVTKFFSNLNLGRN